ncbi:MAG: sugar ABC transporter substrate-binding protein [Planctomycetes bacterium]|nr:sugar ABC transporter substrate-binding protein [Planctomycetota bacterium]
MNDTHFIFYRKDIFAEKGLKPPATFEELEEVSRKLTDKDKEFYGFISRGARSPLVTQFSSYLYSFGGDFFDRSTKKASINTPEFIAAAEFYGRLVRNYGPPGVLNMGWPQAIAVFQQGKGAMYVDCSTQYAVLLDPTKSVVGDKTGIAMFPAGPKKHIFFDATPWAIGISEKSQKKDAAWKFVRWFTDKKRCTIIQGDYAVQGTRMSVFEDPAGVKNFPPDMVAVLKQAPQFATAIDRPQVTQVELARDIVGSVVTAAIEGQDVRAEAIKADRALQDLLDKEG